ncbi:MAG: hypothetical protein AAF497_25590 [Planctomycetota bacterium]
MKSKTLLLVSSFLFCTSVFGQVVVEPDARLWGGGVMNPSGEFAVPVVQYNPANGEMLINTFGLNGVGDTTSRSQIGGDDVGMISISVEGPCPDVVGPAFNGFVDGIVWGSWNWCGGKPNVFGVGAGGEFLRPSEGTLLFGYEPGLTQSEFGVVEMAVNFESGAPGATMFGQVQFVPEPSCYATALACVFGMLLRSGFGAKKKEKI